MTTVCHPSSSTAAARNALLYKLSSIGSQREKTRSEAGASLVADEIKPTIQKAISSNLNPLFRVHAVVVIDALPRTASNKVIRRVLRDEYSE